VGAASKKPAFRKRFSHKRVTELLADKVSILNDPFEAFIWTICVQLDTKSFLAVVEAEDDGSEAKQWGRSAVTFANWLADHEKLKVCKIVFLHLSVGLFVSFSLSFVLSVSCSFSCFPLNSLLFGFCLYLYPSLSLSLSPVLSLKFPLFLFFLFSCSLLDALALC